MNPLGFNVWHCIERGIGCSPHPVGRAEQPQGSSKSCRIAKIAAAARVDVPILS
jgi:hypothetical protein